RRLEEAVQRPERQLRRLPPRHHRATRVDASVRRHPSHPRRWRPPGGGGSARDHVEVAACFRHGDRHCHHFVGLILRVVDGMTKGLLIINGFPATGKTTLARDLAGALGWTLFTKDGIKERLFDVLGWGDEEWSEQLSHAVIEVLFDVAETLLRTGVSVVLEADFVSGASS